MQKCVRFLNTAGTKLILTGTFHTSQERRTWNPRVLRSRHVRSSSVQSLHKFSDGHIFPVMARFHGFMCMFHTSSKSLAHMNCYEKRMKMLREQISLFLHVIVCACSRLQASWLFFSPAGECQLRSLLFFFFNCMLKGWSKIASKVC